jgi:hypothetical protein
MSGFFGMKRDLQILCDELKQMWRGTRLLGAYQEKLGSAGEKLGFEFDYVFGKLHLPIRFERPESAWHMILSPTPRFEEAEKEEAEESA